MDRVQTDKSNLSFRLTIKVWSEASEPLELSFGTEVISRIKRLHSDFAAPAESSVISDLKSACKWKG